MCCHGVGLPLEVFIQGLHAAEQRAGEPSLQPAGPLRPRQASQCLSRSSAYQLHVVEHHTELGMGRYSQGRLGSCQEGGVTPPSYPLASPDFPATHLLTHCLTSSPGLGVHLLPQQCRVEEGSLAHVLGQRWARSVGPRPCPISRSGPHLSLAHVPG